MIENSRNGPNQHAQATKQPHVFVGLATHDYRVHSRTMMSMMALANCGRFKITLSTVSSGGIHKARNNLAWEFLTKTDAEWYLSVDSDISFHPDHVSRLLSHDVDLVGGPYCHKKPDVEWSARALDHEKVDPKTGLQVLNAHGTGFLLIRRGVFEKIRKEQPEIMHIEDWNESKGQTKWDFFSEGIVTEPGYYDEPTLLSEDFYFCKRARQAGFKILVDTTFHLTHWDGGRGYPEKPQRSSQPEAPAPITLSERLKL